MRLWVRVDDQWKESEEISADVLGVSVQIQKRLLAAWLIYVCMVLLRVCSIMHFKTAFYSVIIHEVLQYKEWGRQTSVQKSKNISQTEI